jgi:hypothetical protein
MTTITDPQSEPVIAAAHGEADAGRMPRSVRWAFGLALFGILGIAAYLAVVRGEALLLDLAALGRGLWCF